jgi:hypothetical protein
VLNRSGDPYKPSVLRAYEHALRVYIFLDLGGLKLGVLRRPDVEALVDRVCAEGAQPLDRSEFDPLQAMCRPALVLGVIVTFDIKNRIIEFRRASSRRLSWKRRRDLAPATAAHGPCLVGLQ